MPVPEFSQMLTERRRQLGYSVSQAARALRLKESVLEAFEAGDFASMPKSGYAQGMLASYARFLGLDAQEVTDLFADALADYRAGVVRGAGYRGTRDVRSATYRRRPASNQPQVPRRGLLPTSGGIAGDLGDYATTSQVHPHGYTRPYGTGEPSATGAADASGRYARYDRSMREGERRRRRDYYGRDDVRTAPVSPEYVDDLRFGNDARAYDPASSESGRASYRNIATPERPQVQRRPSSRQRQQVRGRSRSRRPRGLAGMLAADPVRFIGIIVVLVAVIITLILLLAFNSCSFGVATGDGNKSVPVSQTTTSSTTNSSNTNDKSAEEAAAEQKIASSSTNGDDDSETQTVVEVSVANDAVTWVEVDCDGSSKIAETVTGPWSQTYTVTDSITIQVGDTTAVTVTKNGRQMQFDSRASGLGTMTIQGTKVESTQTGAGTGTNSTRTTTSSNANESTNGNVSSAGISSSAANGSTSSNAGSSGSSTGATSGSTSTGSGSSAGSGGTSSSGTGSTSSGGGRTTSSSGGRTSASLGRADGSASSDGSDY